jgi:hypothetical protein
MSIFAPKYKSVVAFAAFADRLQALWVYIDFRELV